MQIPSIQLIILCVYLAALNVLCWGSISLENPLGFPWTQYYVPAITVPCTIPLVKNGYFLHIGDSWIFRCIFTFQLLGRRILTCRNGRFDHEIPVCGKPGCEVTQRRVNGRLELEKDGITLKLTCNFGHNLAGSETTYCDGLEWDRELGECRPEVLHSKVCDFETFEPCGWTQDERENDFNWLRKHGYNTIGWLKFGPQHDHTTRKSLEGHYMVAEAINSQSDQKSYFWSPIHAQADSRNACFRFYYHMFGAYVGRLRVFLKTIDMSIEELVKQNEFVYFDNEISLNEWKEGFFHINETNNDFQIVFEATVPRGQISDIAIDDVALLNGFECTGDLMTEAATEEAGGIYDIQSCENRCTETGSEFTKGIIHDDRTSRNIERCDCHPGCMNQTTCCFDYVSKCGKGFPTDGTSADFSEIMTTTEVPIPMLMPTEETAKSTNFFRTTTTHSSTNSSQISNFTNITDEASSELNNSLKSQLLTSKSSNNHTWIMIASVLSFFLAVLSIVGWKRYVMNQNLTGLKITYKSNQPTDDLRIDFNPEKALLSEDTIVDEPNIEDSNEVQELNKQNVKVNIADKMMKHIRRSQQSLGQYRNLNDRKH